MEPATWRGLLPPRQPIMIRPPVLGLGDEEHEAEEDVDVETVFSSDDIDLSCAQQTEGEVTRG